MAEFFDSIQQAMHEPTTPNDLALDRIARCINSTLDNLDELIALAADNDQPEVQTMVCCECIRIGQCMSRVQLLLSFIESRKAPKLKVIHGKT
jgi:hypothetical protein